MKWPDFEARLDDSDWITPAKEDADAHHERALRVSGIEATARALSELLSGRSVVTMCDGADLHWRMKR